MAKKKAKQQKKLIKEIQRQLAAGMSGSGASMMSSTTPATTPGVLARLQGLLGKRPSDQFLVGALVGAAAVYVLGDEKLRARLIKSGLNLYSSLVGGFEEIREQVADLQAEVECERQG